MSAEEIIAEYIYRELRGDSYGCPNDAEDCVICRQGALSHALGILDALAKRGLQPTLMLSPEASRAFIDALMNPAPPNEHLRQAAEEMREFSD